MSSITIRKATERDAAALRAIYAPYVEQTAITFEYDVPTEEAFAARIAHTRQSYPYFVAEANGEVVGYAYAEVFKDRPAYQYSVETTVYVRRDTRRSGIGRALYAALEDALRAQGIRNMYACIAVPDVEDETLTWDSVRFHERMGFRMIGEFRRCGFKFGRWYSMSWMEKLI